MRISELVAAFVGWCERNRSPATARHYRGRLALLRALYGDREAAELRPLEVEDWLHKAGHWPDGSPKAPDTRRANAVTFERLQAWAMERRELPQKILDKIERPRGRLRERIPTAEEIEAILAAGSPAFRRIYQALRLSGARPNELTRATIADWDRPGGMIVLKEHKTANKTGKPRRIAVGAKLARLLMESIGERIEGQIFLAERGKPWTPATLSRAFRRIRDQLGLPKDLCLYLARHEHASLICDQFGIQAAAEALGHSNLATTRRYVKTSVESLRAHQDAIELPGEVGDASDPPARAA